METRVFNLEPEAGRRTLFHYDHEDDSVTFETQQEVTPLVEGNKSIANDRKPGWKGDLHWVGSIPMNVYMELKAKGILDDQKALAKWLNDSSNRFFRTKLGRI